MPIVRSGYAPRSTQASRTTRRKGGWRDIRKQRLALDRHQCQLRYDGCTRTATSVHLDPRCNGDHNLATLANTTSACTHCHSSRGGV